MCKKLIRIKAFEVLRDQGEMDTTMLRDTLNKMIKHGTTCSELGNILGKDRKLFRKVRTEKRISTAGRSGGNYNCCVWAVVIG